MRISRGLPAAAEGPTAFTIGNFDGVHLGHEAMLDELTRASRRLGVPACVLTFEPHPREFFAPDKAPTRLTSLREKLELLAGCGVDRVHICRFNYAFAQIAADEFIDRILVRGLGARWVLVGDDFRFGARRAGDFVMLKQVAPRFGFEVAALPSVTLEGKRVSSTAVRSALAAGELDRARELLGRPYSISGRVVRGDGLGQKLGFPTANVQMKHNRPPLTGIFAVTVAGVGDQLLRGCGQPWGAADGQGAGGASARSAPVRFRREPLPAPSAHRFPSQTPRRGEVCRSRDPDEADRARCRKRATLLRNRKDAKTQR